MGSIAFGDIGFGISCLAMFGIFLVKIHTTTTVGYAAHLGGALAGLLLGIVVLRNLRKQKWELYVWWVSLVLLAAIILAMMAWNVAFPSYFPAQTY